MWGKIMLKIQSILILICLSIFGYSLEAKEDPQNKNQTSEKAQPKKKRGATVKPNIVFMPETVKLEASPGDKIVVKLKAYSGVETEVETQLVVKDLYTNDAAGALPGAEKEDKKNNVIKQNSILNNILIPEKVFKMKPKQTKDLSFTINVPENAQGSYYFLYSVQLTKDGLTRVKKIRNGMLAFFMNINGIGVISIKDKQTFKVDVKEKVSYKTSNLLIQTEIMNKGDGFLRSINGTAVLLKGNEVLSKIELLQVGKNPNFLPNTKKSFSGTANLDLKKGDYTILLTFQDEKNKHVETKKVDLKVK